MLLHSDTESRRDGFTLIELLTVMTIIAILAGLVLGAMGWAQRKGAMSRAEGEIRAMSTACESYKSDNAIYPRGPGAAMTVGGVSIPANATDALDAKTNGNSSSSLIPNAYSKADLFLYTQLSGDVDGNGTAPDNDPVTSQPMKVYMTFKRDQLGPPGTGTTITYIKDPFGNCYGYSTANAADPTKGYNPTFDLWCTGGSIKNPTPGQATDPALKWIKNW